MAAHRKYAHLLDIDDSPDVYESAEPAVKSQQTDADEADVSDSDTSDVDIIKSRLRLDAARDKFDTARVDASKADFSDRVDIQKESYIVSTRPQRRNRYTNLEHDSDQDSEEDDTDEGLARRIARLNREIAEVRQAILKRDEDHGDVVEQTKQTSVQSTEADLTSLTRALDSIQVSQREALSAHAKLTAQLSQPFEPSASSDASRPPLDSNPVLAVDDTTLSKLAAFDSRLASLETALGLDTTSTPTPVLPKLSLLDRQMALLTSPSAVPDLEAKVAASKALAAASTALNQPADDTTPAALSPNDVAQLRSLHALLPTLSRLGPTVDPLMTRLRSLRYLHDDAAGAKDALDDLERRQTDTEQEIRAWRQGLAAVEQAIVRAEAGFMTNAAEVEKWVTELEKRIQ